MPVPFDRPVDYPLDPSADPSADRVADPTIDPAYRAVDSASGRAGSSREEAPPITFATLRDRHAASLPITPAMIHDARMRLGAAEDLPA